MLIDRQAQVVAPDGAKSSAETLIHTLIYNKTEAQAVLHTHSLAATLLSMEA
jgi:ribulose-5-phosphate 4-epimerase/fuculose-1-phosphate aldolase